jgi:hypothetical protein
VSAPPRKKNKYRKTEDAEKEELHVENLNLRERSVSLVE